MRGGARGVVFASAQWTWRFWGERVDEKKIVKKAGPAAAVCECVWVKKRSLIDTIDSEASRLRQCGPDWSASNRIAIFSRGH